jgi:hypothetical protein
MILQIAYEIKYFVLVLFILLVGFAQAFWIISNVDKESAFQPMSNSLMASFLTLLGLASELDFSNSSTPYVGSLILALFLFVMMILMLNLLVALMNDTFDRLRSKRLALWRREQAGIILDQIYLYLRLSKHLSFFIPEFASWNSIQGIASIFPQSNQSSAPIARNSVGETNGKQLAMEPYLLVLRGKANINTREIDYAASLEEMRNKLNFRYKFK